MKINSRILIFLFILAVAFPPSFPKAYAEAPREITISAAVSPEFKKNPDWKKEIDGRIFFTNQVFQKFGLHFSISKYIDWDFKDEQVGIDILIRGLAFLFPHGSSDLIVGFHKMSQPFQNGAVKDIDIVGASPMGSGVFAVRDPFYALSPRHRDIAFAHEMGHLFGAVHVPDSKAIMYWTASSIQAIELDPDNSRILEITRYLDFSMGPPSLSPAEIEQVIGIYEEMARANPHNDFSAQLGGLYALNGNASKARELMGNASAVNSTSPRTYRDKGVSYYRAEQYGLAIKELNTALGLYQLPLEAKDKAGALNFLGIVYYKKKDKDSALSSWQKGLELDPENLDLQINAAAAKIEKNPDQELTELEAILKKYPTDVNGISQLGMAYIKKENYQKAAQYFYSILEEHVFKPEKKDRDRIWPDIPESVMRFNLGLAYFKLHEASRAVLQFQKARSIDSESAEFCKMLASAYFQSHAYTGAVETAQECLRLEKKNSDTYVLLGNAYQELGKVNQAIEQYRLALNDSDNAGKAKLHSTVGYLYLKQKNFRDAVSELEKALSLDPSDAEAYKALGYAYGVLKRFRDGERCYLAALKINPADRNAKQNLAAIRTWIQRR